MHSLGRFIGEKLFMLKLSRGKLNWFLKGYSLAKWNRDIIHGWLVYVSLSIKLVVQLLSN